MEKITAPFMPEEVVELNNYQHTADLHPFTCGSPDNIPDCIRKQHAKAIEKGDLHGIGVTEGILIATRDGWVCPCGSYKQTWAYKFMSQPIKT